MKKLLFIVNPRAGKTKSTAPLFDALVRFSQVGYLTRVFVTTAGGDAYQAVSQTARDYDLVVCAGGDGTLNEVISGLMTLEHRPDLGYLPNGSTNDFAASLHIPVNPSLAAAAIATGQRHHLDVGRHNDRYFSYVASFGAFTRASYSAPQPVKNVLGHLAYILEGIGSLDSLHPYQACVTADGEEFSGEFIFGAVCNSTSLGGLVKLDPSQVKMDDGFFELFLLRMPHSVIELNTMVSSLLHMDYEGNSIIFRHVKKVTLTTQDDIPWSLDGEYAPSTPRVEIETLHDAVNLIF